MEQVREICTGCHQEIDPEICHCGDWIKNHDPYYCGHTPVPMGCACGYVKGEDMKVSEWQDWVRLRWTTEPGRELTLRDDFIMTAGLGGETGEVLEILKKNVRDGKLDLVHLTEELGDVLFYLTMICNRHGIKLNDVMETNVCKLTARKKKC